MFSVTILNASPNLSQGEFDIVKCFFHPDEQAFIKDDQQIERFYEVWTKRESRIKWKGKGLHIPLLCFSVFDVVCTLSQMIYLRMVLC